MTRVRASVLVVLVLVLVATLAAVPTTWAQSGDERVTLTVSVVDQAGDPVPDATIEATWENGSTTETTASNGRAFVDVAAGADVTLRVEHPDLVRNEPVLVRDAAERDVTVDLHPEAGLDLTVRDAEGQPLSDVEVTLRKDGQGGIADRGPTDGEGVYLSPTVEAGTYTVTLAKPGYVEETLEVALDGNVTRAAAMESGAVVLTFDVADPTFDPPRALQGVTVDIEGAGTVNTVADGSATVSVPVNTDVTVSATREGYRTVERTVAVGESDRPVTLRIRRAPLLNLTLVQDRVVAGEELSVQVTDEYDRPAGNVTVTLDGEPVGRTDADGELRFTVADAGDHVVRASRNGVESGSATVRAIAEATSTTATTETPTTEAPTTTTTPAATTTESGDGGPGFGTAVTLTALAVTLLVLWRRGGDGGRP